MQSKRISHWGDILVLAAYFCAVLLVGVWSLCRKHRGTVRSYFLAGRSMSWIPVGASLFSSNIGSEHFIGLAGTGAASGLAIVMYEWLVSIFAGALFIQLSMGWNMYLSIAVLLVVTGLFTILASLRNANNTCGMPRDDAFHVLRDAVTSDTPWLGTIPHILFGCMWYFCFQRSLAARSLPHAKAGSLVSGYLKILPMFIMIMPGMISRILYPDEIGCVLPEECERHCGNPVGCSNIAYPKLVLELLPAGLRGLLVAVMLSAIMSSMTSIFNSASTLFAMDLWPRIRHGASQRELLIVGSGQLFMYIQAVQGYLGTPLGPIFIFAIFWHKMSEKVGFKYIFIGTFDLTQSFITQAAFWSLVIGHVCGVTRMVMDFSMEAPGCGEPETRPAILYKVHFTYFGVISFTITSICIVVISFFTEPSDKINIHCIVCNSFFTDKISGLTWWTRNYIQHEEEHKPSLSKEIYQIKGMFGHKKVLLPRILSSFKSMTY
ncbi:SC5AB-like protein [Mya arenaria]|uniref:SC5AB-like protein n=1 Tax=Mya arenaria TaxID=6604 RepID=A0ABY7DWF7_MYAAR|nr:SC5AB-like protein [Mya arenaria]